MLKPLAIAACAATLLAGCVAPEEPATPRTTYMPPPTTTNTTNYEDAPIPNRTARQGPNDSIIRLAH